jgi:hypothetical protein
MLQNDDRASAEMADRVLEVAEELELTDVIADTLVTRGVALMNLGRGIEGIGLVTTALELARSNKLAEIETRALGNLSVSVGTRHIGDGIRLTHELIELEHRMGVRSGLTMMNAAEVARLAGDWEWVDELQSELLGSDLEGIDRLYALGLSAILKAARGELRGGEQEELDRQAAELNEPSATLVATGIRPEMYLYTGRLRESRQEAESQAKDDLLNATLQLNIAAHAAVWDGDLEALKGVHRSHAELGGRGPLVAAQRRVMQAGIDALEGRRTDALAGYRQAMRELDDNGAVLDGAYTAIDMAVTLGPSEPEVRAEIDRARATLRPLRAKALLDRLDAVTQGAAQPADGAAVPVTESRVNDAS